MPHDDADSGDDDADSGHDSAELATLEALMPSEEAEQAAISEVPFEWCATVREAGERYRDGESIPVIAVECGVPMKTAREAVKTYHLVFTEPPLMGVRSIVFDNGRRYFVDDEDVEELDAATRVEAEEHVQAFVGRTLLDNELDDVDIEKPVPLMEVPPVRTPISMQEIPSVAAMESLNGSFAAAATLSGSQLVNQRMMSQAAGLQQAVNGLSSSSLRTLQQAVQKTHFGKIGVTAGLVSSAAVSSVVASSALTGVGVEPSILQAASQPAVRGLMEGAQTMAEMNAPAMVRAVNAVNQSAVHQMMQEMQSLPVLQMADLLEEHRLQMVAPVLEQLDSLQYGLTGMAAMGAVAARPAVGQGFAQEEVAWSPVQSEPQPTFDVPGIRHRMPDVGSGEALGLLAALFPVLVEVVFFRLQQLYPDSRVTVTYAKFVALALIELWLWNEFRQR